MYEAFYEMKQTPFVRNIPSEELYESPAMAEAFARLNYAADRQLFAVLTSDAGCGKSTLIRRFNDNLPKDKYLLLYVSDSKLTPKWLYKSLLDQLGLEAGFYRGDAKRLLQKQIEIIRTKEHRKVVCVLDLVGQNELWDQKLRYKRYAAIRQRIDITCILPHLDLSQTQMYIDSNLHYAGVNNPLFTEKAVEEICKSSTGIPRIINRVCEKCLTYAGQQRQRLIDEHIVQHVIQHEMLTFGENHD